MTKMIVYSNLEVGMEIMDSDMDVGVIAEYEDTQKVLVHYENFGMVEFRINPEFTNGIEKFNMYISNSKHE